MKSIKLLDRLKNQVAASLLKLLLPSFHHRLWFESKRPGAASSLTRFEAKCREGKWRQWRAGRPGGSWQCAGRIPRHWRLICPTPNSWNFNMMYGRPKGRKATPKINGKIPGSGFCLRLYVWASSKLHFGIAFNWNRAPSEGKLALR